MNQYKLSKTVINKLVSSTIVSSLLLTSACTKTDNINCNDSISTAINGSNNNNASKTIIEAINSQKDKQDIVMPAVGSNNSDSSSIITTSNKAQQEPNNQSNDLIINVSRIDRPCEQAGLCGHLDLQYDCNNKKIVLHNADFNRKEHRFSTHVSINIDHTNIGTVDIIFTDVIDAKGKILDNFHIWLDEPGSSKKNPKTRITSYNAHASSIIAPIRLWIEFDNAISASQVEGYTIMIVKASNGVLGKLKIPIVLDGRKHEICKFGFFRLLPWIC